MSKTMFFVFLRNDGLIGAIAADNRRIADARLAPAAAMSFDILLETDDWATARSYIEDAYADGEGRPAVAGCWQQRSPITSVACRVCNDTGTVWSPDPDGCSAYESDCPEPIHDEMARAARQFTEDRRAMEQEF